MNLKTMKFALLGASAAAVQFAGAAVPEVTSVKMSQDASRLVTIAYTLENGPAVVTVDIETNDTATGAWASIGGKNIQRVTGDVWKKVSGDGGTIRWQADLDWPDHKIAGNGVRAVVTAWALDNTPDYMIVDLSPSAAPNSQEYYPGADFIPGGLLTKDDYRTTRLVMKKVMAKDVKWTMGSITEEKNKWTHYVTLDHNYYIGVFEITQAQWKLLAGTDPSNYKGSYRPVEKVSYVSIRNAKATDNTWAGGNWPDAPYEGSFLDLLRDRTGLDFDLPSDAEWEFACRAGHGEGYWGNGEPESKGELCPGRYNYQASLDGGGTAVAGHYEPNSWGIYDMHGNVWEWCLDWWVDGESISNNNGAVNVSDTDKTKSRGGTTGTQRMLRGGSAGGQAAEAYSAMRWGHNTTLQYEWTGFRVACRAGLK